MCFSRRGSGKTSQLVVGINSADKLVLQRFASAFGGNVLPRKASHPVKRQLYHWELSGKEAQSALAQLVPFLDKSSKFVPAVLALQPTYSGKKLSPDEKLIRGCVERTVSAYNHRVTVA